jgi:ABC-type antimicrobial peptide transport system permease subunit
VIPSVRQSLLQIDPNLPMTLRPMSDIIAESTLQWRVPSLLLAVLGGAALFLASLGIYGVISYSVAQRRREIGVRMSLGATSERIRKSFVAEGLKLSAVGIVVGVALALVGGRVMSSALFGVSPFDPVTNGGAVVLFALVAALASLIPAIRASRVDPQSALRTE